MDANRDRIDNRETKKGQLLTTDFTDEHGWELNPGKDKMVARQKDTDRKIHDRKKVTAETR